MRTKHLCVLIHIRFKGKVGTVKLNYLRPPVIFLLAVSRRYFFCGFFFILCLSLSYGRVCVMQPYGHLLGKGRLLGSHICDVFLWRCHFPIRYSGPDVVLDCIDSASLPSSLLSFRMFVVLRLCGVLFLFFPFTDFSQKFEGDLSGIASECQTVLIQIRYPMPHLGPKLCAKGVSNEV